jgi:acyl-CoA thioester hydrolase
MIGETPSDAFYHPLMVQPGDIDHLGHVNNVVYVGWVQEVAIAHWMKADPAMRKIYSWVLLRHEIDYKNPAFLGDPIGGFTWVGEHHGPRFERFVRLINTNTRKVLIESKTFWCLLDAKSLRPKRIGEDILTLLGGR